MEEREVRGIRRGRDVDIIIEMMVGKRETEPVLMRSGIHVVDGGIGERAVRDHRL